jgi:hypothetical protein
MEIPVLLERVEGNGYRARGLEPFGLIAEGATREEAIERLRELLAAKLHNGGEIVSLTVPCINNPLARMPGIWDKDDPLIDQWIETMKENRRKADEDPDYL